MKYLVSTTVSVSCYTTVEAESPEQAKELVSERPIMQAPFNMGGQRDEEFVVEEFDSEPDFDKLTVSEIGEDDE